MTKQKIFFGIIISFALLFLFSVNYISADGCCFNPSDGLCDQNSLESACTANGAEFYNSPSCAVSPCSQGCCVLGASTEFVTSRTCQLQSVAFGFEMDFRAISAAECANLGASADVGACLSGGDYEKNCKYTSRSECGSGDFHPAVLCSNSSLNTICKVTNRTMCYGKGDAKEDVHYLDSCGNADALKEDCDYQAGTICAKKDGTTDYFCKSLNCANGKANGKSWCIALPGMEAGMPSWKIIDGGLVTVGSRFFTQYCIDGEVQTEPCADYRQEICGAGTVGSQIKCDINPWDTCFAANGQEDPITGLKYNADECDKDSCIAIGVNEEAPCSSLKKSSNSWDNPGGLGVCSRKDTTADWVTKTQTSGSTVTSVENPYLTDLGIGVCAPIIAPGQDLGGKSKDSTCSMGDFTEQVVIVADWGKHHGGFSFGGTPPLKLEVSAPQDSVHKYGYAGLISTDPSLWIADLSQEIVKANGANPLSQYEDKRTLPSTLPVDPSVIMGLSNICQNMGDCVGKTNWVGADGSESGSSGGDFMACRGDMSKRTCTLNFKCLPWKAPEGGSDCGKCGADKLPCSKYRCESLGKRCKYSEPDGADKGFCISSDDRSAPVITLKSIVPPSPIPPYFAAEFTITTNKDSECKFNLDNAGVKFSDMKYDFGQGFDTEHKVKLSLPGQLPGDEVADYPILTGDIRRDLNHTLYVRCVDGAGNGETMSAYPINFMVMQTQDTIPPVITSANPISGSAILFNTTSRMVNLKLNEPAECRWSQTDKRFDQMENNFTCETQLKLAVDEDNYTCSGLLTDVTLNMSLQTRFFIRCKDQPWLANDSVIYNGVTYARNINDVSYEYVLRPSSILNITNLAPAGSIKKTASANASIVLSATTSGGALSGKAICSWRLGNESIIPSAFMNFTNTGYTSHTTIVNYFVGDNFAQVKCIDSAGNIARLNSTFNIFIDQTSPVVKRIYQQQNNIKIKTDEESICYASTDKSKKCSFDFTDNGTIALSGSEKEHTFVWKDDKTFYIKCKDYYGNYDIACNQIIRTY